MDATRRTTDMIDRQTLADAYEAYVHGMEVGRLAARLDVYPAELQATFNKMTSERERRAKSQKANTMGRLQDALFAELDRLDAIDITDTDALKAEVERSKAVEGIVHASIANIGIAIEATRLRAQYTQSATVKMPKLLEG